MDIPVSTFLKRAIETAEHFGFHSVDELKKNPACKTCEKGEYTSTAADRKRDALHGLLTGGMCTYFDSKLHGIEAPIMFYTVEQIPRSQEPAIAFHVFNVEKSIAEALLIQATRAITDDLGFKRSNIRINSLGDKESNTRYLRELTNFLRKRIDDMPESARELMKDHAFTALTHLLEKQHELGFRSPSPMEYLSDPSRKHFRELVEFLDMAEHDYEIDPKLLGHYQCYSDAIFAIDLQDDDGVLMDKSPLYIRGGRYNEYVNQAAKGAVPAAGAVVVLRDKKASARVPKAAKTNPGIYVVQLGFGPKIRSLILVDELRRAGINVYHDLANDSLSAQLRDAEAKNVPYVAIIGQKEFVENGVILRDMQARSQDQIDVATLITKLRRSSRVETVKMS